MFSIVGYMFFKDDFLVTVDEEISMHLLQIRTLIILLMINDKYFRYRKQ